MFDCFIDKPDLSFAYKALPNRVSLTDMNPLPTGLKGASLRFTNQSIRYGFHQIDRGYEDLLNRIVGFTAKGKKRYPAWLAGFEEDEDD